MRVLASAPSQCYNFKNVRIGSGGGFVSGIVFNPGKKGLAYARTDIGGAYKLKADGSHGWDPLQDAVTGPIGVIVEVSRVYLFAGLSYYGDPNNASILCSTDYGRTFSKTKLPFKTGGNMPGRGMGERIDSNMNRVLYLGNRSGNGLYKSSDYGATWSKVTMEHPVTDPRIFVGVAEKGTETVYVTEDGGYTWFKLAGQPVGYISHRGVFSPKEKVLYVSYTDGTGPYDGSAGYLQKYNLTDKSWTDISPIRDAFGFGGLAIDLQKPGTLMTWRGAWEWAPWPQKMFFNYDVSSAPWLYDPNSGEEFRKLVGWMIESLTIDPFDLYGTGANIFGSRNALNWDTADANNRNITLESVATGIEETSIQAFLAPPNPVWSTTRDLDYAGNVPSKIVRIGTDGSGSTKQVAIFPRLCYVWRTGSGSVFVSTSDSADFVTSSGVLRGAIIGADRRVDKCFYAASGSAFYASSDGAVTFTQKTAFTTSFSSAAAFEIVAHLSKGSDVWVSSSAGLHDSTDGGNTWTSVSATAGGYPAIFLVGVVDGMQGVYRSDDAGVSWFKINDATKWGGGSPDTIPVSADLRQYGRVSLGMNGRGIFQASPWMEFVGVR
ncbi:glycoside hydrolase family 74 protein [Tirmania nivea]|nr:glycoside hydrolase family 74 protein [Tirmania nivea]